MASSETFFAISLKSVLEDVLKEHGRRPSDVDLASRKAEDAESRRYEAARWLRRTVGFACSNDLPEDPTEDEFRLGLRSGFILCTALNRVHPGAVPKVVLSSSDSLEIPDGAALSAYQYFENVRNFLVAVEEIGLPTFDASDFEQGGKSSRIINCILALKSYNEWKRLGRTGSWKFGANTKPFTSGRPFVRKVSEPFSNSLARTWSNTVKEDFSIEQNALVESLEVTSPAMSTLVRAALSDKQLEEIPSLVESMLSKVVEEFERRIACQNELASTSLKDVQDDYKSFSKLKVIVGGSSSTCEMKENAEEIKSTPKEEDSQNLQNEEPSKEKLLKQCLILDQQERYIQELRHCLQITKARMEVFQTKYSDEIQLLGKHICSLGNAASGYHTVLEENRKLYNQVQDLKGNIRVYCRVRPHFPGKLISSTVRCFDERNITIINPSKHGRDLEKTFTFNKVFGPSASQDAVFSDTQPLIRSVLDGYNVCIFAYGQTGSGKTYTMNGPKELNQQSMGVNYRALSDLFSLAEQRRGIFDYEISVQMIEIYNEQVRDLLTNDGSNRRLDILNGSQNGVNVPHANLVGVSSTADVIEIMNIGQRNRAVGATALNDRSSRSHSCLIVHARGKDLISGTMFYGCMHLIDLAGSERVYKSEVAGERLREAQHINKSLSALGDVISALAQKNSHVPYRNSKVTQLLQDSLGGQAKTLMFVHISPEMNALSETISTLKFAERVSTVELGAARMNKESAEIMELKEQIASLKAAASKRDAESDQRQTMMQSFGASKVKTTSPSPAYSSLQYKEYVSSYQNSSSQTQIAEEFSNKKAQKNSVSRQRKPSFDLQDLLMAEDLHHWSDSSPAETSQQGDDRELASANWVDKIMVDKLDDSLGEWDVDGRALPEFIYQRYASVHTEFNEQQFSRDGNHRHHFEPTDDSDDLDIATSDSSEADALWQFNIPRSILMGQGDESKIKKPQIRVVSSPDVRTPTRARIPSPSRKTSSGATRTMSKQLSFGGMDAKRASSVGKVRGGK